MASELPYKSPGEEAKCAECFADHERALAALAKVEVICVRIDGLIKKLEEFVDENIEETDDEEELAMSQLSGDDVSDEDLTSPPKKKQKKLTTTSGQLQPFGYPTRGPPPFGRPSYGYSRGGFRSFGPMRPAYKPY